MLPVQFLRCVWCNTQHARERNPMMTRLLVLFLCLGILSTVSGCSFQPNLNGTSFYEKHIPQDTYGGSQGE